MSGRLVAALLCAGCVGEIAGAGGDDGLGSGSIGIAAPADGTTFVRDQVAADGAFVAVIELRADVASDEIVTVDWLAEGTFALGSGFAIVQEYRGDGDRWVDAVARGAGGATFEEGPENPGVATPVTVDFPLNGMPYRYSGAGAPRESWMMDCELALALTRANAIFAAHHIVEVVDIGVYNYRCIDQSVEPPDCPGSSLSMHAHAMAIDLAGFTTADGAYHSVNDDWVIDPDGEDTCGAATANASDALLHDVVCELHGEGVFAILLTPNYNSAHRNHFHVDLTPGGDFLGRVWRGVDVGPERH